MAFKIFDQKQKVENLYTTVAEPLWSDAVGTITTFFTGSTQNSNNGKYYNDVYTTTDDSLETQFSVTYGHINGSGSESSQPGFKSSTISL